MIRCFVLLLAFLAAGPSGQAQDAEACGAPQPLQDGWATGSPTAFGLDARKLCELDKFIAQWRSANIHAVFVARRGKLAFERYYTGEDERLGIPLGVVKFGPDVLHDQRSISKSVTSLLVGIALGEGRFPALDSPVFDAFPEHADLSTPEKARITFRHLLTMSSGLAWNEAYVPYSDPANNWRHMAAADPVRYVLERKLATPPGEVFAYGGGSTTLLAAALAKATGRRIDSYAREKLFAPLDITDVEWSALPGSGMPSADAGLRLRPRDMAKLGQLMLADGKWNGRQVVPRGWAAESAEPRIAASGSRQYGYQWWLGRTFHDGRNLQWTAGFGLGGQRLFIQPDLDLVVAINAGDYGG